MRLPLFQKPLGQIIVGHYPSFSDDLRPATLFRRGPSSLRELLWQVPSLGTILVLFRYGSGGAYSKARSSPDEYEGPLQDKSR